MTRRLPHAAVFLTLGLTACGTTAPTRYLTLAPSPAATPHQAAAGLILRPPEVRWPAAYDRLEVTRPTDGVAVTVEEFSRWSAPPAQLAVAALTADLTARLPGGAIAPWTEAAPADAVAVSVQVETLSAEPAGYGLVAQVTIARGGLPPQRWRFQAEADGAHDAEGEAWALSRLLGALSDRIAEHLIPGLTFQPAASAPSASPRPAP